MKQVVVGIIPQKNSKPIKYLLMSSTADFGEFTGFYYPPGGHLENNESEEIALKRELKEELALEINPLTKIISTPGDVPDQITHWWLCQSVDEFQELVFQKSEVKDIKWLTREQILQTKEIWSATRKFFKEIINN